MATFVELKEALLQDLQDNAGAIGVDASNIRHGVDGLTTKNITSTPALFLYMIDEGTFPKTPLRSVSIGLVAITSAGNSSEAQDIAQPILSRAEHIVRRRVKDVKSSSGIDLLSTASNKFVAACELRTVAQPTPLLEA